MNTCELSSNIFSKNIKCPKNTLLYEFLVNYLSSNYPILSIYVYFILKYILGIFLRDLLQIKTKKID